MAIRLDRAIRLDPAGPVRARLTVPGDKSISHRALLLNAIAGGEARVTNLAPGEDLAATLGALAALGVAIERPGRSEVLLRGGAPWRATEPIDCRNSGTTARLLLGLLAPRASAAVLLTGDDSLRGRPMARVVEPLRAMGAAIEERGGRGRLPLAVVGRPLAGRSHRLPVASAQVKSALLLAGLAARSETEVEEPTLSRDHTERMLAAMGARIERIESDGSRLRLRPGPIEAIDVEVPGDLSSAAPLLALAAGRPGSEIAIEGVGLNPTRTGFLTLLGRMGARIDVELESAGPDLGGREPRGTLRVAGASLSAIDVGPDEVPLAIDELPLVAVLATQAEGVTRVRGAGELRVKESDRIDGLARGLRAMGANVEPTADGFEVEGPVPLRGAALDAGGDHRIAMALAVAALLAEGPSRISGAEWVAVSYPDFFAELAALASGSPAGARA